MKIRDIVWDEGRLAGSHPRWESRGIQVLYYEVYYAGSQWWATGDDDEGHNYFHLSVESSEAGKAFCNEDNKKRIMEWVYEGDT